MPMIKKSLTAEICLDDEIVPFKNEDRRSTPCMTNEEHSLTCSLLILSRFSLQGCLLLVSKYVRHTSVDLKKVHHLHESRRCFWHGLGKPFFGI